LPPEVQCVVERECRVAEVHLRDAGLRFSARRSEPIISMVMRETLDAFLVSAAQAAGAHLQTECEVHGLTRRHDHVELATSLGTRRARFVVAADGALSPVARMAGWPDARHLVPALEYEIHVADGAFARLCSAARFDLGHVPFGYAWVFPKKEHLSVGVVSMRRGRTDLTGMLEQYLRLLGLANGVRRVERHGFVIPVRPRRGSFVSDRVLLAGDAAGFAEPLTGEGITLAIQSGHIAARALLASDLEPDRVRHAYDRALRRTILPELRWGSVLSRLTYDAPRARTWLARWNGSRFSELLADVFAGGRTYRELLTDPRNYLRVLNPGT
jgi:flavin-dependent dehydrogenase